MRDERLSYVNPLRLLFQVMAFLLCIGLLLFFSADGGSLKVVLPSRSTPVVSSGGQHNARITMDLFYASKRRVPKGPDPIHNSHMLPGEQGSQGGRLARHSGGGGERWHSWLPDLRVLGRVGVANLILDVEAWIGIWNSL